MTNEEAIKEIKRWIHGCPYADTKEAFELAIKVLEERQQGEWIDLDTDESWYRFKCSNCLSLFPRGMFMKGYPYCPRCGAKMQHD